MPRTAARPGHHAWAGLTPPVVFADRPLTIRARGNLACFTRPEFGADRMSYPVPTPTAMIGMLSSVFWKPQFRWVIDRIDVLAPVAYMSVRRNELSTARTLANTGYTIEGDRQQRNTLFLRDVDYRVHAHVWVHPDVGVPAAKWRDQFTRRLTAGAHFRMPYLGQRECFADLTPNDPTIPTIGLTERLGPMLHSIDVDETTGAETYDWFDAHLVNGSITVPRQGLTAGSNLR